LILTLAVFCVAENALASDPPHWVGAIEVTDCTSNCHMTHQASGGQLTANASNVVLCQSCHDANNLPINDTDKAIPGSTGRSHQYDIGADNPAYGAQTPQHQEMNLRIMGGNVVCSTCHNQHLSPASFGGTPRIGEAQRLVGVGGSLTSGGTFSGANGVWYLVEITLLAPLQLQYSTDNEGSWVGPVGFSYGNPVSLGDGVEVTVTSGVAVDDRWEFYASYPFLRVALDSGDNSVGNAFCRDCHRDYKMDHSAVEEDGWGTGTFKSHPVGIALDANGKGYDRTNPLDGDGGAPGTDGNPTNDLKLDSSSLVQCTTCHGVHYADSNTLSVDQP